MNNSENIPLIDIHSHLKSNEEDVIRIHNLMYHEFSSGKILPGNYYSLGMHPWHLNEAGWPPENSDFGRPEIIAVGETGLDKFRGPDITFQEKVFKHHIEISEAMSKPLIIHNVRMTDRILKIYKEMQPKQPWILHGFTGNPDQTKQLLNYNFYFSFSERVLKSQKSVEAFRIIPLERVFVETDEGELGIKSLYHEFCILFDLKMDFLTEILYSNFKFAFQNK
jgi:TatD DNase family protein